MLIATVTAVAIHAQQLPDLVMVDDLLQGLGHPQARRRLAADGQERGRGTNAFVLDADGRITDVTGFWAS